MKQLVIAIVLALNVFAISAVGADRDWEPKRTWVVVVGVLKWSDAGSFPSFPQKNRRDLQLVDFFRRAGVPAAQIVHWKDEQATTRQIQTRLPEFLSHAKEGDFLFLYYCGHGYKSPNGRTTLLATYDASNEVPGWSTDAVFKDIETHFKGSRALVAADCCYSGSLARKAERLKGRVSYACLASSLASELSTGNWTFTEMLLAALEGKPWADLNSDGLVTLGELGRAVEEDMAFAEEQRSLSATTGALDSGTVMAIAERKRTPEIGRRVEVLVDGTWYKARVIDVDGNRRRVHYYGYEVEDQEWVEREQIRDRNVARFAIGSKVEVLWKGTWYPARVLDFERGVHLIHYVGYDSSWDEWVSSKRIRR